jgi:hypothetical protein
VWLWGQEIHHHVRTRSVASAGPTRVVQDSRERARGVLASGISGGGFRETERWPFVPPPGQNSRPRRSLGVASGDPRAVSAMAGEQFLDFANEMHVAVAEEAYLWELPRGSRDMEVDGSVQHGPRPPANCSAALLVWFNAGLLWLLRRGPEEEAVPNERVADLLRSPEEWVLGPDGSTNVAVVATAAGESVPGDDWVHALHVLRPA